MVQPYLISYSVNGGEVRQEKIIRGSKLKDVLRLFETNMKLAYETNYRIHSVWVLSREFNRRGR